MFINFFRAAATRLAACFRRIGTFFQGVYQSALERYSLRQQGEHARLRGHIVHPVYFTVFALNAKFSMTRDMATQLGFGCVYGIAVSALNVLDESRNRLRASLALAGVLPGAIYYFSGGISRHVVPMIVVSAAVGTEIQRVFRFRGHARTIDSIWRTQSVECLLVAWLIVVGGNSMQVSQEIQAMVILCLDLLSSRTHTKVLTRFFLRVILVAMAVTCLLQIILSLKPKTSDRRRIVTGASRKLNNSWPLAKALAVFGMFAMPVVAVVYRWVKGRQGNQEDEENPTTTGAS
ncbi:hypothetical protein CaCOL14_011190 [Colletotrichum acutatum]